MGDIHTIGAHDLGRTGFAAACLIVEDHRTAFLMRGLNG